jgi:MOSC domain-containing protein YiiM
MKLITISVGRPQLVDAGGEDYVMTAIFKKEVSESVSVGELNIEGDAQADLRVHGGRSKAVYVYPSEHYSYWKNEMPDNEFEPANFGENLSTEGLLERQICIGDQFRIGTAEFVVTQPRMPCAKLGVRFGRKDIIRRFLQSRRSGFYLAVTKTGMIAAGDPIEMISYDENKVSVHDILRLFVEDKDDIETLRRAINVEVLPDSWKGLFHKQLNLAAN